MAQPPAARLSGDELGQRPRNYGHLLMLAGGYAHAHLDGQDVVNRATGWRIGLRWPTLQQATARGVPPVLALALPALPAMLAAARYVDSVPPRLRKAWPQRLHLFSAAVTIAGQPVECWLIVRQDGLGRLFFDRLLLRDPVARRQVGGGTPGAPGADGAGTDASSAETAATDSSSPSSDNNGNAPPAPDPSPPRAPVYEPRTPLGSWESLPPGDARDAAAHGYDLDEWLALKRGEPWSPPAPTPLLGFWTRLRNGLAQDADQSFGGSYGLSPQFYDALGGDRAPLTRFIWGPLAKAADLLGNPRRGPAFLVNAGTRTAAELLSSLGLTKEDPERVKDEFREDLGLALLGAGMSAPEVAMTPRVGVAPEPLLPDLLRRTSPNPAAEAATEAEQNVARLVPDSAEKAPLPNSSPALSDAANGYVNANSPKSDEGSSFAAPEESATVPTTTRGYSVAYSVRLPPELHRQPRRVHIRAANEALLRDMEQDPDFAKSMSDVGIMLKRTRRGLAPATPPSGWSWHHDFPAGEMQLIPLNQHSFGSRQFKIIHPSKKGGFATWGGS